MPINDDVVRAHLDGTQPIGVNMNVGDGKSHFAMFDFDDHSGSHETSTVLRRVGFVAAALTAMRIPYFFVRSGGGNGFHIWVVFNNASRADSIRKRMSAVLESANSILLESAWLMKSSCLTTDKAKACSMPRRRSHARRMARSTTT